MKGLRHRAAADRLGVPGVAGSAALHVLVLASFLLAGGLKPRHRPPPVYRVTLVAALGTAPAATPAATPAAAKPAAPRATAPPPRAALPRPESRSRTPAVPLEPARARQPAAAPLEGGSPGIGARIRTLGSGAGLDRTQSARGPQCR